MVNPAASRPTDAIAMPMKIECTRRMRATRCETQTTNRMIMNESRLIIHSCATIGPRGVWVVNIAGRCMARTRPEESTQSTMKLGSRSNSCMNMSQKPDMMRMNVSRRRLKRFENVRMVVCSTPPDFVPPASTLG